MIRFFRNSSLCIQSWFMFPRFFPFYQTLGTGKARSCTHFGISPFLGFRPKLHTPHPKHGRYHKGVGLLRDAAAQGNREAFFVPPHPPHPTSITHTYSRWHVRCALLVEVVVSSNHTVDSPSSQWRPRQETARTSLYRPTQHTKSQLT